MQHIHGLYENEKNSGWENNFPSAYFFAFSGCLGHPAGGETLPNPWMIMKELFDKYFDHEPEI